MIITSYPNGNTHVTLEEDGTKTRVCSEETAIVDFPETIDIKITNQCDLKCPYCHEDSHKKGVHGDLRALLEKLYALPRGIELAIGGGNPLAHPDLEYFLGVAKSLGFICNLTVNSAHFNDINTQTDIQLMIEKGLIKGIGVSVCTEGWPLFPPWAVHTYKYEHLVFHLVAGVHDVKILDTILENVENPKVLILGYKSWGRGIAYHNPEVEKNIRQWAMYLPRYFGKMILSFDNLAIEQLAVKRFFTDEGWNKFYMGDDGKFSMYIDAIKQQFAKTSRSETRTNWKDRGINEWFVNQKIRLSF